MKSKGYDVFGNIVVMKFSKDVKARDKKQFAEKFLKGNKPIKTVLEKTGKFKGRLRKMQTRYIAGEKTKEALYKENGCVFRFNIDTTYFSPRLSNERKEIAKAVRRGEKVLVMFAGVAPYSVVIAKNSKAGKVVSVEINKEANKYAKLNVELNKLKKRV
ncbi:MAG TPA: class I SAM-dependent methyltransferase family protein, partial [Candidatus Pacearchaeota archaeon]|nr:class I SAM-dependent methyltransferase family protein [Candidatus Pacearchaeota archaeon]